MYTGIYNKKRLINDVSADTGLTKSDIKNVLEAAQDRVDKALVKGERVDLFGFGKFEIKVRSARRGINPNTMEKVDIPETNYVKFKESGTLKKMINPQLK